MNQQEQLTTLAQTIRAEITPVHPVRLQNPAEVALLMCLSPGELYNFGRNCQAQIVQRSQRQVFDFYDCSRGRDAQEGSTPSASF